MTGVVAIPFLEITYMGKCFEIDYVLCCKGADQHHVMPMGPSLETENAHHSSIIISHTDSHCSVVLTSYSDRNPLSLSACMLVT